MLSISPRSAAARDQPRATLTVLMKTFSESGDRAPSAASAEQLKAFAAMTFAVRAKFVAKLSALMHAGSASMSASINVENISLSSNRSLMSMTSFSLLR